MNYLQGLNGAGMNGANNTTVCSNLSGGVPCTGQYIMYQNLGNSQDITEDISSAEQSAGTQS